MQKAMNTESPSQGGKSLQLATVGSSSGSRTEDSESRETGIVRDPKTGNVQRAWVRSATVSYSLTRGPNHLSLLGWGGMGWDGMGWVGLGWVTF